MKIKFLITGLLGLLSVAAFAQKGELNNAKEQYEKYDALRGGSLKLALTSLTDAKTSIDKASLNDKTSALPLTFALKGAIYAALTVQDTVPATSLPNFKIADDALGKAKSLDSVKQENKKIIDNAYLNLAQYQFNKGRAEFQDKKFEMAYHSFDYFRQVLPNDTTALYATGLAAANVGATNPKYYTIAITDYNKLLTTNYSQNATIYYDLSSIYLSNKDTANAFKIAGDGVAKYPTNNNLRRREIEIGLQSGKQEQLISKIDAAIASDPKNKTLYYYQGITYAQIAESIGDKEAKTKDPVAKAALEQQKVDNYNKAADQYKKAIAIDPNYAEAGLSLGYVVVEPALDLYNAANQLPTNQQKKYDADMAQVQVLIEAAKPYLQKAVDLNPKSPEALQNLKSYYLVKRDMTNANLIQKKIEALK
ncbi:tetratricopeptide repeat protein [Mucilaginibacter sp. X5P1]|uniref:tetratricopeptide repeat protein n=1 Tax=Mucilaginibacter sp. X5P1 TaxID=2723088 RepID=UPI00161059CA|nr:tetratricopeptide repeat protein [Mucilaginibacter sp. X5P1]MBB6136940.1 hypothetical protein [Mucilaginibacter sp. X5P1]